MLITAEEYVSMGFPEVTSGDLAGCIMRSEYIIGALTEGRAAKAVEAGGKPAELVKQAAAFQTYMLLHEMERIEKTEKSGTEKVSLGDYSYSSQTSENSENSEVQTDCDNTGLTVVRLLYSAGCMYAGVEVVE